MALYSFGDSCPLFCTFESLSKTFLEDILGHSWTSIARETFLEDILGHPSRQVLGHPSRQVLGQGQVLGHPSLDRFLDQVLGHPSLMKLTTSSKELSAARFIFTGG